MIRFLSVVVLWAWGSLALGQTQLADYPLGPVEDAEGRLWFGSVGSGAFMWNGQTLAQAFPMRQRRVRRSKYFLSHKREAGLVTAAKRYSG